MSLELRSISFRYRRSPTQLLQDVNLRVDDGEAVALMAPSGAGKSTLLAIAGLLIAPNAGEVRIDDQVVAVADARHQLGRSVSWVLQSVNLLPRRSILDNVVLPAVLHAKKREVAEPRARELLGILGLTQSLHRQSRTLSGGEAQRVGVARALLMEPRILIADEPTANLDRDTARVVAEGLLKAAGQTSVLLATHDPAVAAMADRVVHL